MMIFMLKSLYSLKKMILTDISKAAWMNQWHKTKRMDFLEEYTMMGQYMKESILMDVEV